MPKYPPIQIGQKIHKWTVIGTAERDSAYRLHWTCQCECGTIKVVADHALKKGVSKSCGCYRAEANRIKAPQQRNPEGKSHKVEYSAWKSMIYRCYDPSCWNYADYGGRGIYVCDEWKQDFWTFYR